MSHPGDRTSKNSPDENLSDENLSDESLSDESLSDDLSEAANVDATEDDDAPWISDEPVELPPDAPKKHSAELFPIPPAASSQSGTAPVGSHRPPADEAIAASPEITPATAAVVGPLPLVETAFLASAASLMWLINSYFPPGPLLRILFPLPIALIYLRWNLRSAWMSATVSGLLLTILLGPTRSIFFVMPYGFLGVQLGYFWRRRASWELSILTGSLLVSLGTFFRIWLLSILSGEDLWGYLVAQITQFLDWLVRLLTNWGWVGLGSWGQPSMEFIAIAAVITVLLSNMVYMLTVHLAAWLVLERLGVAMPAPPGWVQVLIEE